MRTVKALLFFFMALSAVLPAMAQTGNCNISIDVVPDGRQTSWAEGAGKTDTFYFLPVAGHSYSIEAMPETGLDGTNTIALAVFDGLDTTCATPLPVNVTTAMDPQPGCCTGSRVSITATPTLATHGILFQATIGSTVTTYNYSVTDTTLYNPRWSTTQGYITVYGFENTSTRTIHGTLTVNVNFGGSGVLTYSLNGGAGIAAGAQLLVAMGPGLTINVPAGEGGTAMLSQDGPPGGLTVDAYFANANSLVPAVFAPRNSQH